MQRWMTVEECARELGVCTRTIYEALWAGQIPGARKIRRTWRIPRRYAIPDEQVETVINQEQR